MGFGNLFVSQSTREFYMSHFLGKILVCAYNIWQHGEIWISCTIPCESPIIILLFWEFFTPVLSDGFYLILSDSKSLEVSRTFLSILADLNNAAVWIVSSCHLISKFSSPCACDCTWVCQLESPSLIIIIIIVFDILDKT